MKVVETKLAGLLIVQPQVFGDERGHFLETFRLDKYRDAGIELPFVQDNFSRSKYGTLRGLHFQNPNSQGKLVQVTRGEVYDVAVDLRRDSSTHGQWLGIRLCDREHRQLYIPPGFAHGFCVLSEEADVFYKCTDFYQPACEHALLWNDPDLGIDWPIADPILSSKDSSAPTLRGLEALNNASIPSDG